MRGIAVPYVTNRAIQNRLDEVVGPENWYNKYRPWIRFTVKVRTRRTIRSGSRKKSSPNSAAFLSTSQTGIGGSANGTARS